MVIVSCSTKLHSFNLAEQLDKHQLLSGFYTSYAYQKNIFFSKLAKRIDKEHINAARIHTNIPLAIGLKSIHAPYFWNDVFERWVASRLTSKKDYKVFVGWSGMSLMAIRQAKRDGKIVVLERGSSHILYQNKILQEEYRSFNIDYTIDPRVIKKELQEYSEADFISIPSQFVRRSFIEYDIPENKLISNPYGVSNLFQRQQVVKKDDIFRVLYLGTLSIRKGLKYLFEALSLVRVPQQKLEVVFIGSIEDILKPYIEKVKQANWKFLGHIAQHELAEHLSACDIGVHPSIEEGLSMVMPQMLACGLPIIATTNTGAEDIIEEGISGFIVPVRSAASIAEKIDWAYEQPIFLAQMKQQAEEVANKKLNWNLYGDRYAGFIHKILENRG